MHHAGRRPGKQFIQSCRRPAIDELREDVGKPILGTDAVELARLNERSQQCPILGTPPPRLPAPNRHMTGGVELEDGQWSTSSATSRCGGREHVHECFDCAGDLFFRNVPSRTVICRKVIA